MSILIGPMKLHLNGHKELTSHGEVKDIAAGKKVDIPLQACTDILVNAGDYVKKGTNCVYFFQENADGKWNNTTLTVELLEELLEIAKNNR